MIKTDEIISQFFAIGRKIKRQLVAKAPSITLPQLETLHYIKEQQPVAMKYVANFLAITPPTATVVINTLVRAGLISRRHNPKNRRVTYLHLTSKGEQLLKKIIKQRCAAFQSLFKNLNQQEQLTLFRLMNKLAGAE